MNLSKESNYLALFAMGKSAAVSAANVLRRNFSKDTGICSTDARDIKTKADREAERVILESLCSSGLQILSEEGGGTKLSDLGDRPFWVVDPLDGTLNYTRGFPMACVSVALWQQHRPLWGVVVDLEHDSLCEGRVGRASEELMVSAISECSQAIIATGFPSGHDHSTGKLQRFVAQLQTFKKVRLLGSAALSLTYVSQGIFDAYCEEDIWLWDVAAGVALVLAAGGAVWMTPANEQGQVTLFASNGLIEPPPELFKNHEDLEKYSNA